MGYPSLWLCLGHVEGYLIGVFSKGKENIMIGKDPGVWRGRSCRAAPLPLIVVDFDNQWFGFHLGNGRLISRRGRPSGNPPPMENSSLFTNKHLLSSSLLPFHQQIILRIRDPNTTLKFIFFFLATMVFFIDLYLVRSTLFFFRFRSVQTSLRAP